MSALRKLEAQSNNYDASGDILSHATPAADYAFAFDAKNRLAQATVGAIPTVYGVNGLGQRVIKATLLYKAARRSSPMTRPVI